MPGTAAKAFILAVKAGALPASQSASALAMSLADTMSSASSICRSVSCSLTSIGTVDSSRWISLSYSATSAGVTVMTGPGAPAGSG